MDGAWNRYTEAGLRLGQYEQRRNTVYLDPIRQGE